jgi:hypothetical protein
MAPCTKVRYVDLASARTALAMVRKKAKPGAKAPRRVYPCEICKGWHLTSKKSGRTPAWDRRGRATTSKGAGKERAHD